MREVLTKFYYYCLKIFSISVNYTLLNEMVSLLKKEISLEFVVLVLGYPLYPLGYSSGNLPVIHYMLVEEKHYQQCWCKIGYHHWIPFYVLKYDIQQANLGLKLMRIWVLGGISKIFDFLIVPCIHWGFSCARSKNSTVFPPVKPGETTRIWFPFSQNEEHPWYPLPSNLAAKVQY